MNGYLRPELVEVSGFMDTVNLASGTGDAIMEMKWANHNSGSHSILWTNTTFPVCNGAELHFYLNDMSRSFLRINSCSRGTAEIKDNGRRIKVTLNEFLNGGTNVNLEIVFTPSPYKDVETGGYKVPINYDARKYTPREDAKFMPYPDEPIMNGGELFATVKIYK